MLTLLLGVAVGLIIGDQREKIPEEMMEVAVNSQTHASLSTFDTVPDYKSMFEDTIEVKDTIHEESELVTEENTISAGAEVIPTVQTMLVDVDEAQAPTREVLESDMNIYAPVLQQYREAILMDSKEFLNLYGNESELDLQLSIDALKDYVNKGEIASIAQILDRPTLSERFPYVDGITLYSTKMFGNPDNRDLAVYHYAYYDIDDSGSHELLIGEYDDYNDDYSILAIYMVYSDEPRLIQAISDNDRWHLSIYTDGTFCVDGSGGATIHYWTFYRMNDMFALGEEIDSFTVNYDTPRSEYMTAAVAGYEAMLTPVEDIVWQPLI